MKKATAHAVAFRRIYDGQSLASLEMPSLVSSSGGTLVAPAWAESHWILTLGGRNWSRLALLFLWRALASLAAFL